MESLVRKLTRDMDVGDCNLFSDISKCLRRSRSDETNRIITFYIHLCERPKGDGTLDHANNKRSARLKLNKIPDLRPAIPIYLENRRDTVRSV